MDFDKANRLLKECDSLSKKNREAMICWICNALAHHNKRLLDLAEAEIEQLKLQPE